jgi:hypothetical protein
MAMSVQIVIIRVALSPQTPQSKKQKCDYSTTVFGKQSKVVQMFIYMYDTEWLKRVKLHPSGICDNTHNPRMRSLLEEAACWPLYNKISYIIYKIHFKHTM